MRFLKISPNICVKTPSPGKSPKVEEWSPSDISFICPPFISAHTLSLLPLLVKISAGIGCYITTMGVSRHGEHRGQSHTIFGICRQMGIGMGMGMGNQIWLTNHWSNVSNQRDIGLVSHRPDVWILYGINFTSHWPDVLIHCGNSGIMVGNSRWAGRHRAPAPTLLSINVLPTRPSGISEDGTLSIP